MAVAIAVQKAFESPEYDDMRRHAQLHSAFKEITTITIVWLHFQRPTQPYPQTKHQITKQKIQWQRTSDEMLQKKWAVSML